MPQRKPSLINQTFGKLKVIGDAPRRHRQAFSICLCECGRTVIANNSNLKRGVGRSCVWCRPHIKTHEMSKTPTYVTWAKMNSRCNNPEDDGFMNYGGRGITVCDRWKNSFENFFADMGERPPGTSLDRRDNNKGYYKENCHWATRLEQANNSRINRIETVRGITDTVANLIRHFGVDSGLVRARIQNGWDMEKSFFAPVHRGGYPPKEQPPQQ